MNSSVSVSVIMPIYNSADYIRTSLQSIISQTYQNFDLLLIDDCGVDDSVSIAESFLKENGFQRYKILCHEINKGPSQARNTGLTYSQSEYVLFCDSDDVLDCRCLEILVNPLLAHKYDFIIAGYWEKRGNALVSHALEYHEYISNVTKCLLSGQMNVMPWNKLCRRDFLVDEGVFFEKGVHIHEDYIWTYKLCCKSSSAVVLPDITYVYNVRADSLMTSLSIAKDLNWYIIALDYMVSFVKSEGRDKIADDYKIIEGKKNGIIYSLLQKGEIGLYNEVYHKLKELVYISPFTAYKAGMIGLSYLIRDIHYCFPVWLGKLYKRIFYLLYYKLLGKPIKGLIWEE